MGTLRWGILGNPIGKIGTIVGQKWRGGLYTVRAYTARVGNPNTNAQMQIRRRFAAAGDVGGAMLSGLQLGFANILSKRPTTPVAQFVKVNWDAFHTDGGGSVTIDYSYLVIAQGALPRVLFGAPQFDNPLQVDVNFTANADSPHATANDKVYVLVYCPDARSAILSTGVARSTETIAVTCPAYWNGMKVHVWGFAVGGSPDNKGIVSDSTYVGTGNLG